MEIVAPLLGLAGVLVGASIQWVAATHNVRTQYNVQATNETKAYLVRALKAADLLRLVHGLVLEQFAKAARDAVANAGDPQPPVVNFTYTIDSALQKRLDEATAEWRSVITMRYLMAPEPVSDDLRKLDEARGRLTELTLSANLPAARAFLKGDFDDQLKQLKLGVSVAGARMNVMLARSFLSWWNRPERRAAKDAYLAEAKRYNAALPAPEPTSGSPTETRPPG